LYETIPTNSNQQEKHSMKLKLKIDSKTSAAELIQLGMLFTGLGLNQGAKVVSFSPPADEAELDEPEVVVVPEEEAVKIDAAVGNEPPKRRRRTKDELRVDAIVAENARVAAAEAEAQANNEAGLKAIEEQEQTIAPGEAGNVQPADTQPASATEAATTEPATESPSDVPVTAGPATDGKTYTAAEVQQQATVVARTHGADLVKTKIAELGGARIADLNADQVNELGAYLFSVK
jgi:hypothetical protein